MVLFAIRRGEIEGRLNSDFYHPERRLAIEAIKRAWPPRLRKQLTSLVNSNDEQRDIQPALSYVGLANVKANIGTLDFSVTEDASGKCKLFQQGQILYGKLRPYLNKVHIAQTSGQCSTEFYVLNPRDPNELAVEYLSGFLQSKVFLSQTIHMMTGNTHPRIRWEEFQQIWVPVPSYAKQIQLGSGIQQARTALLNKLSQADDLLTGFDNYVLNLFGVVYPPQPRKVFAIRASGLTNNFNPDRYRGSQLERSLPFRNVVGNVCDILVDRTSPSKEDSTGDWDWIRIDDLRNHPWEVDIVRTEIGINIQGALYEVRENDILLARLGPTIQNAKFVLCPPLNRRTVASSEFLVLRCRDGWNPEAVLWILRTKLYRDIMYYRTRGGTPSRYRLDGADLSQIPFPEFDDAVQQALVSEVRRRREEVNRLNNEVQVEWEAAKQQFEEQLLAGSE
jgi:hypothetical protein